MNSTTQIHPKAEVLAIGIGEETGIGPFTVVSPSAKIGSHCRLGASVSIGDHALIGDSVVIEDGARIANRVTISDGARIGTNVVFLDAPEANASSPAASVHTGAMIGGGSTIMPGITIGRGAMVSAGSMVDRDVPSYAIVAGNPAGITGYVNAGTPSSTAVESLRNDPPLIPGLSLVRFNTATDLRGDLMAVEFTKQIPFPVRRAFFVTNVPSYHVRGEHGHKQCHQLLVCLQGSLTVSADNGRERGQWLLNHPGTGLHIHPMVWAAQYHYSQNAVLAVFASHPYDPDDYIRNYEDFLDATVSSALVR